MSYITKRIEVLEYAIRTTTSLSTLHLLQAELDELLSNLIDC